MSAIGKGDLVEALFSETFRGVSVTSGTVYRCDDIASVDLEAEIGCGDCANRMFFLLLSGFPRDLGFCPCGFKPISGGQPGMFSHLLKLPADAPREPVAA